MASLSVPPCLWDSCHPTVLEESLESQLFCVSTQCWPHSGRELRDPAVARASPPVILCPSSRGLGTCLAWEDQYLQIRTGPSWHPDEKVWMLWYTGGAYATSQDGVHWDKPILGLREQEDSTQNNLMLPVTRLVPPPVELAPFEHETPGPGDRVGKHGHPAPLPPNCTCDSPAYSSPVSRFLWIGRNGYGRQSGS